MRTKSKPTTSPKPNRTLIVFDLAAEITPEELARFESSAAAAGSKSLTEHFLNINLRLPKSITGPAG
jgi:hypothetical protein